MCSTSVPPFSYEEHVLVTRVLFFRCMVGQWVGRPNAWVAWAATMTFLTSNAEIAWDAECTADSRLIWTNRTFAFIHQRLHESIQGAPLKYIHHRLWLLLRLSNGAIVNVSRGMDSGNVSRMGQIGASAVAYSDSAKTVVLKQVLKWPGQPLVEREVCVLRKLSGLDWSAKLLCFDFASRTMVTTHIGEPLGPVDLLTLRRPVERIGEMVKDLEELSIEHLDITKQTCDLENLTQSIERMQADELTETLTANHPLGIEVHVRNGRMSLIDYNTAKFNGTFACGENLSTAVHPVFNGKLFRGIPDNESLQRIEAVRTALVDARVRTGALLPWGSSSILPRPQSDRPLSNVRNNGTKQDRAAHARAWTAAWKAKHSSNTHSVSAMCERLTYARLAAAVSP